MGHCETFQVAVSVASIRLICNVENDLLLFAAISEYSSTPLGIFLHGIITAIITTPLCVCSGIVLDETLDPMHLWFRNIIIISFKFQLIIRLVVTFLMVLQASMLIFGFGVIGGNVIVLIMNSMEAPTSMHFCKYVVSLHSYRELEIINHVVNTIFLHFLPVFTLIMVVLAVLMGYMLIKMTSSIALALVILEIMQSAVVFGFILIGFPVLADVLEKSNDLLRNLKLQRNSPSRKRQLRSCTPLKIWVGPYFFIHNGTGINLLDLISYYTMSLVISV